MSRPPASLQVVARNAGDTKVSEVRRNTTLPRDRLSKWVRAQEAAIEQAQIVAAKALAAGDLAKSLAALHLAMRAQAELIALVAPKRTATKSKSPTEDKSEPDADGNDAPGTPRPSIDFSQMSDVEVLQAAGMKPLSNGEVASSTSPVAAERKPPPRPVGRPKGYEASGAAKEAKERACARRANEKREREAGAHLMRGHDATIAWPMPPIPEEWE